MRSDSRLACGRGNISPLPSHLPDSSTIGTTSSIEGIKTGAFLSLAKGTTLSVTVICEFMYREELLPATVKLEPVDKVLLANFTAVSRNQNVVPS